MTARVIARGLSSSSPADRDGEVKHREHICPLLLDVEVGDDGGSNGGVAGLPDSDQASGQEQGPEMLRDGTM